MTKALLAAIYPPLVILLFVTVVRLARAIPVLRQNGWERSLYMALGAVVMLSTLMVEQIYYGVGRFMPNMYDTLAYFAPAVGFLKVMYLLAIYLWTKAYFIIMDTPPQWRFIVYFSSAVIAASFAAAIAMGIA